MNIHWVIAFTLALIPVSALAQFAEEDTCARLAEMESKIVENPADHSLHVQIASCYASGRGTNRDIDKAMALLDVPAAADYPNAVHMLASLRLFKTDDPALQKLGFDALEKEYQSGSAFAAGKIGWAYQRGLGVSADRDKALQLYEHAARNGMTYWQYLLAHAYERGYLGLDVDPDKSAYWLDYKPKMHVALYECWVASYYDDGTFPEDDALQSQYQKACDETT